MKSMKKVRRNVNHARGWTRWSLCVLMLVVLFSPLALFAQDATDETMKIAVATGYYRSHWAPLMNRLKKLKIPADWSLSQEQLFGEKRLFLYDALVIAPHAGLEKEHYEDIKTFISKGGVLIPFYNGGTYINWGGGVRTFTYKKGGVFYELTGSKLLSWTGTHLREFSVLCDSPITKGFKIGERLRADVKGIWARYQAEGTIVLCGNATLLDRAKTEQTKEGNVIQVRKYGKGATIWITAKLHESTAPWVDRLLRNIFSRKTLDWCRQLP